MKLLPQGVQFKFGKPNTSIPFERSKSYREQSVKIIRHYFPNQESISGLKIGSLYGNWVKQIISECKRVSLMVVDTWEERKNTNEKLHEEQSKIISTIDKNNLERLHLTKSAPKDTLNSSNQEYDFCFIDSNGEHPFKFLKQDLISAFDAVREGGIIGGNNFLNNLEVTLAVGDFFYEKNIKINIGGNYTWWIKK